MQLNPQYRLFPEDYLFSEVRKRAAAFAALHPEQRLLHLGIGDATRPLAPIVVQAMQQAVTELGETASFRGYGPEQGYDFLRQALADDYKRRGIALQPEEFFINDGAKADLGNILELFDASAEAIIPDPTYPVYADTNRLAGRKIRFLPATEENDFQAFPHPQLPSGLIYLCSPNNPTGAVYSRETLTAWVRHALTNGSIILFDAAYASFISAPGLPASIYEIDGAEQCSIEFGSFSKSAGFTGLRCGWTIFPNRLQTEGVRLAERWRQRQATRTNGVCYVVQRGAEAALSPAGIQQTQVSVQAYLQNAGLLSDALRKRGVFCTGGSNAPYVWFRCPEKDSRAFFERFLHEAGIIGTPGSGFGKNGQGFFRLSGFGSPSDCSEAAERIQNFSF